MVFCGNWKYRKFRNFLQQKVMDIVENTIDIIGNHQKLVFPEIRLIDASEIVQLKVLELFSHSLQLTVRLWGSTRCSVLQMKVLE